MISYGKQYIDNDDIESVIKVLRSDYLTQGPTIEEFESKISQYCGASYCRATSSATAALHLACLALGVNKGDIIWTSAISFVASANCALYCCASVSFLDINLENNNICIES
jgi:dTDP-4-amino-4,6-dideoxygalactose transaminase